MKVREAIRLLERDDWFVVAIRGSHRQYRHPYEPGRVTVPRKAERRLGSWNAEQHPEASRPQGEALMRYAVVIEKAKGNYSAYVPDLPGCVTTGDTLDEVSANIREAIRFHLDGLRQDGLPIPAAEALCDYVDA